MLGPVRAACSRGRFVAPVASIFGWIPGLWWLFPSFALEPFPFACRRSLIVRFWCGAYFDIRQRGTSAARARASATCRAARRTRRRASTPRRASGGSVARRRLAPQRGVGGCVRPRINGEQWSPLPAITGTDDVQRGVGVSGGVGGGAGPVLAESSCRVQGGAHAPSAGGRGVPDGAAERCVSGLDRGGDPHGAERAVALGGHRPGPRPGGAYARRLRGPHRPHAPYQRKTPRSISPC